MIRIIMVLLVTGVLSACAGSSSTTNNQSQFMSGSALQAANTVVQTINQLQNGGASLQQFTNLFDANGVRFSADYYIDNTDRLLTAQAFEGDYSLQNPPLRVWGVQDGSGNPISLNIRDYFTQYVWNHPYHTSATVKLINAKSDFNSQGNLINNMLAFYPLSSYRIVEYYQPGTNPSYNGMDWTSLMVVLKNQGNNQWSLVGLVHGAWTI